MKRASLIAVGVCAAALLTITGGTAQAAWLDDLDGYWRFESDTLDSSGNAQHGVYQGTTGPDYQTGKFGDGIALDGSDQKVVINPTGDENDFSYHATDIMSLSLWARVDAFDTAWQALIAKGEGNAWRMHRKNGENTMKGPFGDTDTGTNINDGAWHHFVAVNQPGTLTKKIWVDGVLTVNENGKDISDNSANHMMIGDNPDALAREWNGMVDDVAIWGRVLSDAEAAALWNGGAGAELASLIPEPATLALAAVGLLGLRRRKRA